jgi:hypothetical protein
MKEGIDMTEEQKIVVKGTQKCIDDLDSLKIRVHCRAIANLKDHSNFYDDFIVKDKPVIEEAMRVLGIFRDLMGKE